MSTLRHRGLGSRLAVEIRDEYPSAPLLTLSVLPLVAGTQSSVTALISYYLHRFVDVKGDPDKLINGAWTVCWFALGPYVSIFDLAAMGRHQVHRDEPYISQVSAFAARFGPHVAAVGDSPTTNGSVTRVNTANVVESACCPVVFLACSAKLG